MYFVLILTATLTVCVQTAPQFNNFKLEDWGSREILLPNQPQTDSENYNRNNGLSQHPSSPQFTFTRHHRLHDKSPNYRESNWGQCWDPIGQTYRDSRNGPPPPQYPPELYNGYLPNQNIYNPSMYSHPYPASEWRGPQPPHGPPPYNHEHGPPSHHHGYRSPPPHREHGQPPHHHGHGPPPHHHHHGHGSLPHHYGHGPPPSPSHHGHGPPASPSHHGHGPPPSPSHHGHGSLPLPPRPLYQPPDENQYELELCEEMTTEIVHSEHLETSTSGGSGINIPSTPPNLPITSEKLIDAGSKEDVTPSTTTYSSVKSTTEFDWNNFYPGASVDNSGGAGMIDIRGGGISPA